MLKGKKAVPMIAKTSEIVNIKEFGNEQKPKNKIKS